MIARKSLRDFGAVSGYLYDFATAGALIANSPGFAALAGSGMPDVRTRRHILETSLKVTLTERSALRLYHRFERGRFTDWHYDGLPLVVGNELFLGGGPDGYAVHAMGVFVQFSM